MNGYVVALIVGLAAALLAVLLVAASHVLHRDPPVVEDDPDVEPEPEGDTSQPLVISDVDMARGVPRSFFDHPHEIRHQEDLDEEYEQPLPMAAASTALSHEAQRQHVRAEAGPSFGLFEGIDAAETWDPNMQAMVREHEAREINKEMQAMMQTPFIQRMLGVQTTYLRWKRNIKKFGRGRAG